MASAWYSTLLESEFELATVAVVDICCHESVGVTFVPPPKLGLVPLGVITAKLAKAPVYGPVFLTQKLRVYDLPVWIALWFKPLLCSTAQDVAPVPEFVSTKTGLLG